MSINFVNYQNQHQLQNFGQKSQQRFCKLKKMFSNSGKMLAWVKKPSEFNLKKIMSIEQRKELLIRQIAAKPQLGITRLNEQYREAYEIIKKQKQLELMKYENSILWSPQFTPWHFKYWFALPACFVFCLITYIHYIAQPRKMLYYKRRYGIKFPSLEPKGWLIGWLDEYRKPDSVLQFQAYTLKDMDKLYKEGVLTGGSQQINQKQQAKAKKRKSKFIRGQKEFVLGDFKTT